MAKIIGDIVGIPSPPLPLSKGNEEGGIQSLSSKALTRDSVALGYNTSAGCKGYFFKAIDPNNKKIYLTNTQPTKDNPPIMLTEDYVDTDYIETDFTTPEYDLSGEVSKEFAITMSTYYAFFGCNVTDIENNVVTYTGELPFSAIETGGEDSSYRYTFYIPGQPAIGSTEVGHASFSEGENSNAFGRYAHAEGYGTMANAFGHAEGRLTEAGGSAHAEGQLTKALGAQSHAEGYNTRAVGDNSHAEGLFSEAIGHKTHAEGYNTRAIGEHSHAENNMTEAKGKSTHAEGYNTKAEGDYSHSEGFDTHVSGKVSHVEGQDNSVPSDYSHVEGQGHSIRTKDDKGNTKIPHHVHIEGLSNIVGSGAQRSHTEGYQCENHGEISHVEGYKSRTFGSYSHAEGRSATTEKSAMYAHVEGRGTTANSKAQHVQGMYNKPDSNMAHILGNGTSDEDKSNAHTVDWDGNAWFAGEITVGDKKQKVATTDDIKSAIDEISASGVDENNLVHKDGHEVITGMKTFNDAIQVEEIRAMGGISIIGDGLCKFADTHGDSIKIYDGNIDIEAGNKGVAITTEGDVKINGDRVVTEKDIENIETPELDERNLVHKTDDEEISGNKTFSGDVRLNRIYAIMPEGGDGSSYIGLEAGTIGEAYAALGIGTGAKIEAYLDYDNMGDEHYGNRLALSGKVLINGKEVATKEDIENITTPTIDESNLVHRDGNEEIGGVKEFKDKITVKEIGSYDQLKIYGDGVEILAGAPVYFESTGNDANIKAATEINLNAPKVLVNYKEVATKDDIPESPKIDESNLVHKTDDEEISGVKKFTDKIVTTEISSENEGLNIDGWDNTISIGTQSGLILRGGSQINLVSSEVKIGDKYVATKEDITPIALREVSTHNADTNSHSDIRDRLNIVEAVAEGAGISETFNNYAEMVSALNEVNKSKYKKGRNINIITVGVPDLWVAYVSDASVAYNYTTDEAFVEELKASGTIQVGYFKLAMLETQKVDLADYAKKEDITSALGGCVFKQVSQEEYDAMFAEGSLLADVIYIVGGNANAS